MNESQKRDPRMWERWRRSGAIGTYKSSLLFPDRLDENMQKLRSRGPDMQLVGKSLNEVMEIKKQHAERLMSNPNVVGVGIGIRETEESRQFVMRVYLKEQPTPEQFEGMEYLIEEVPLMYLTVGEIRAGTETSITVAALQ